MHFQVCIFLTSGAAASPEARFHEPRCEGDGVCSNDSLLFTCTIAGRFLQLTIPTSTDGPVPELVQRSTALRAIMLPDGYSAEYVNISELFSLTLSISMASLLMGENITCEDADSSNITAAGCIIYTGQFIRIIVT